MNTFISHRLSLYVYIKYSFETRFISQYYHVMALFIFCVMREILQLETKNHGNKNPKRIKLKTRVRSRDISEDQVYLKFERRKHV